MKFLNLFKQKQNEKIRLFKKNLMTDIKVFIVTFILTLVVAEYFFPVFCDAPTAWQLGFQDPATSIAQGIFNLHNDLMMILILVAIFVTWMLIRTIIHFNQNNNKVPSKILHNSTLEIWWTVTPSLILMIIAVPSFVLLYSMEEIVDPDLTLKIIGHQWYWSYEYSDFYGNDPIIFDSYMIPTDELDKGFLRLLEVDNRVVLPINSSIRLLITSADVIHSWTIPSFGLKIDACPGRLNQGSVFIKRAGVFYGQCSELCGVNHGFMPIVVEATPVKDFLNWVNTVEV